MPQYDITGSQSQAKPVPPKPVHDAWQGVGTSKTLPQQTQSSAPIGTAIRQPPGSSYQLPHRRNPQAGAVTPMKSAARPGWTQGPTYATPPRTAPTPGSWAARLQHTNPTPSPAGSSISSTPRSTGAEPPTPILNPNASPWSMKPSAAMRNISNSSSGSDPPAPSTDWRQHSSPQVQRAIKQSSLRIVNGAGSGGGGGGLMNSTAPAWPSLKDFPAAPGLRQDQINRATVAPGQTNTKVNAPTAGPVNKSLQGAWASRSKPS
jgi:hypothetical protein